MANGFDPNRPLSVSASGGNVKLGNTQQRTINTLDPFQRLLYETIFQSATGPTGQVPASTLASLERATANPSFAAEFFPQLAEPLLAANRQAQQGQVTQLTDLFRQAGGTGAGTLQSGAFGQAARQLLSDQGQQNQTLLAQNYIPLTQQLSNNALKAIKLGLDVPQATQTTARTLAPLAASINPRQVDTETLQAGTSLVPPPPQPNQYNWWNNAWNTGV